MDLKHLTQTIAHIYLDEDIVDTRRLQSPIFSLEPIIKLSPEQERKLWEGNGQSNPDEYKQINSSTGLAVNYYKILERTGKIDNLWFEDKVEKPLRIQGGFPANIDASYKRNDKQYYIESKFLEPYYYGNEHNRQSYFNKDNYPVPEKYRSTWYDLLVEAQSYKYYNFSQLCRHLLAIWRKHEHDSTPLVLQSVTWLMPDYFIEKIEHDADKEDCRECRKIFMVEAKRCQNYINNFLKTIGWEQMTFKSLYYNDIIDDISSSPECEIFKNRYLL